MDSGWDRTLVNHLVHLEEGAAFTDAGPRADATDRVGHGTACITLAYRVAPGAAYCPVRVFEDRLETSVAALRGAVLWAVERGFDVVNLSLGTALEEAVLPLYEACERARDAGTVVVAASDPAGERRYPAIFENVVSVGTGPFADPFDYEFRPGNAVECLACGPEQETVWLGGEARRVRGSSYAAPNVTGLVALFRERHPRAPLDEVREFLARHAVSARADREAVPA